jgi:hypothetical protein
MYGWYSFVRVNPKRSESRNTYMYWSSGDSCAAHVLALTYTYSRWTSPVEGSVKVVGQPRVEHVTICECHDSRLTTAE